jgi:hypothetical protein
VYLHGDRRGREALARLGVDVPDWSDLPAVIERVAGR